jgi:iron complex transport system ATP-binding protein
MVMLSAEQLGISYGDVDIVKGLNMKIPKGKITTIIGPNGCGKSTILKTMSRLIEPKAGAVYLDGKAIHQRPTKEIAKKMAIMPLALLTIWLRCIAEGLLKKEIQRR